MAVNLSAIAGAAWQFFSNSGVPLAGGKLYTYAAGTTTPQPSYTSNSGLTANANPIILDSAGRLPSEVWLTSGVSYKFVLKTSLDVEIGTYDNIPSLLDPASLASTSDNSLGDALVGFKQSNASGFLTGATARTVNGKLQEIISVMDFGAVGDGITDDTAAIQAAINYAQQIKAFIHFPAVAVGYLSGPLTIGVLGTNYTCGFIGDGYDASGASQAGLIGQYGAQSQIKLKAGANQNLITVVRDAAPPIFRNMTFRGNSVDQTGTSWVVYITDTVAQAYYTYGAHFYDCYIIDGKTGGLFVGSNRGSGIMERTWIQYCGAASSDKAFQLKCFDWQFNALQVGPNNGIGWSIEDASQIQAVNCALFLNYVNLKINAGCGEISFVGGVIDSAYTNGVEIAGGSAAYSRGARMIATTRFISNGTLGTNTYADIAVTDETRLSLIGNSFGGTFTANTVKYCINQSGTCVIQLSGNVASANTGNVYATSFANSTAGFVYAGGADAYVGQPGGAATLSTVTGGVERNRVDANYNYFGGTPFACSMRAYNVAGSGWIDVSGDSGGTNPYIVAAGTGTDVNLNLGPKGAGLVNIKSGDSNAKILVSNTGLGFQGTFPLAKPTVTGSRGGNAALASLLTALDNYGLITNSSS
jgi:hypothetical protein